MSLSNCVSIVNRMDPRDQEIILSALDRHLAAGLNPRAAQRRAVQEAIDGLDQGATLPAQNSARLPVVVEMTGRQTATAKVGSKVVGLAHAWEDSNGDFVIMNTEVRSQQRRRGIATEMYRAIELAAGKQLKPAISLSDDAFEFWKSYRPASVAMDLRHWKGQLVGARVMKDGLAGEIVRASGGSAVMRYEVALPNGTQSVILRRNLNAALAAAGSPTVDFEGGLDSSNPDARLSERQTDTPQKSVIQRSARAEFYSQLQRAIEGVPDRLATMAAPQWKLWLDANAGKLGVKKDEIEWSGVKDYLTLRGKDKVTREEVAAYLGANGVRVEEVVLGADVDWAVFDPIEREESYFGTEAEARQYAGDNNIPSVEVFPKKDSGNPTKYGDYTVPGGTNYREILITLPEKSETPLYDAISTKYGKTGSALKQVATAEELALVEKESSGLKVGGQSGYKSSHFDQPNILAHLRVDDRVDSDGQKVLFINEVQSDWSSDGRKKGFQGASIAGEDAVNAWDARQAALLQEAGYRSMGDLNMAAQRRQEPVAIADAERIRAELGERPSMDLEALKGQPPAGPFVTDTKAYVALVIKHAIMHAASNGYDKVAFINGQQAADLYDLSKQVSAIDYSVSGDQNYHIAVYDITGTPLSQHIPRSLDADGLEQYVGKEMAKKIVAQATRQEQSFAGLDLKVGGEGMKTFYDTLVPQVANDVLKKLGGGKMGETQLSNGGYGMTRVIGKGWQIVDAKNLPINEKTYRNQQDAAKWIVDNDPTRRQPSFDITPAMREKMDGGVPLFSERVTDTPQFKKWFGDSQAVDADGEPLVVYHGTQSDIQTFDLSKIESDDAFFFTTSPVHASVYAGDDAGGNIMPSYLRMENPYEVNVVDWNSGDEAMSPEDILMSGYDGFIIRGQEDGDTYAVFNPAQIKSALGNNGDFDGDNPNIQYSARTSEGVDQPDVIIGSTLGTASNHPDYEAAKGGDIAAAVRLVKTLVDASLVSRVRALMGDTRPLIVPVVAVEASGRNKIPRAAAEALAIKLGIDAEGGIGQRNSPQRTGMDGVDRLFSSPVFEGNVISGQSYILLDDTITQGGTFAALASHILANGGTVLGSVALTGKQYSAKIQQTPYTAGQLREQFSDIESAFRAITGYGFDALTEFEARYIARYKPADAIRVRILAEGRRAGSDSDSAAAGDDLTQYSIRAGNSAWDEPAQSRFDDFVYKAQDKMIDVKRVINSITKTVGKIADDLNVYLQEELFHGRAAKATQDFGQMEMLPLMKQMEADGYTFGDVEEYLHARHAKEANAVIADREAAMPDGGSGMFDAEADAYFAKLSPSDELKLDAIATLVDAIIAKTRQSYVDYGLESQATVDGWNQMFRYYVPLQREDKNTGGSMGIGQGFSIKGKETKGRTGSTRKVVDILSNIAMQRERLIVRGEKNRVAVSLVGLATANPNPDFWVVGKPPTERVYDAASNTVIDRADPMFKSRPNVMAAKVRQANGDVEEVAVNFNEEDPRALRMAIALKNMDAGQLEGLMGVSAKITRYFSAINTQWNPVFGVVNLVRDVQGAMINLDATPLAGKKARIAKDTVSALAGIYADLRAARQGRQPTSAWAVLWDDFQASGGQTGFRQMFVTSQDRADELQNILTPHGWMNNKWGKIFTAGGALKVPMAKAQDGAASLFNWLTDYNDAMENAVRLATYKAALDQGMSKQEAASLGKNLTVNFNRKGQMGQQAGALYAFFNAAMQGSARIGQTIFTMDAGDLKTLRLSSTGKKVVYGGMLLGSLQALALAAAGFDDTDPPDFVRERALIIPTGGKTYVAIPMPLGYNVIVGLGRNLTEFALSGFDKPGRRAVSMIGSFADGFNPIGNAGMSIQTIAPTIIDPFVALTENRDFAGRPIARISQNKAIPGHTQYKDTASYFGKMLSEGINWSTGGNAYVAGALSPTPDQIDYLLGQVTGGVGRELGKVEQSLRGTYQGEDVALYKIPLVGRFAGNAASQASQSGRFYDNVNKLNELETEVKGLRKDGKTQEATDLLRSRPESYLITRANAAERQLQRLRREKRALIESGASREAVKAKEEQATAVMLRMNQALETLPR